VFWGSDTPVTDTELVVSSPVTVGNASACAEAMLVINVGGPLVLVNIVGPVLTSGGSSLLRMYLLVCRSAVSCRQCCNTQLQVVFRLNVLDLTDELLKRVTALISSLLITTINNRGGSAFLSYTMCLRSLFSHFCTAKLCEVA